MLVHLILIHLYRYKWDVILPVDLTVFPLALHWDQLWPMKYGNRSNVSWGLGLSLEVYLGAGNIPKTLFL